MPHRIGPKGLALVKSFESFVPHVYDDLVPSRGGKYAEWNGGRVIGTLTIGYGHTNAAKHPLKIRKGLRITEAEAVAILDVDMDECEADVTRLVKVPLTQGQFDALASFTFNCGAGSLKPIADRLNRRDYAAARAALALYVKSKGKTLAGLIRRRAAEQALWDDRYATLPAEPVDHPAEVDPEPDPAAKPVPAPTVKPGAAGAAGAVVVGGTAAVMQGMPWWAVLGLVAVLGVVVFFGVKALKK